MDPRILALHKAAAARDGMIGLAGGLPAGELVPRDALAAALAEVSAARGPEDALQYGWPEGDAELRAWIAGRLAARGASIDPERVIVTAGAQQALALVGKALGGARIAVGDATYPAAICAFEAAGAVVVERGGDAAYAITGASNPHGVERVDRAALLGGESVIVADEAYAELRFDGRTPRPLCADAPDRTWHIGTISKTLCPGLRVGWLVPPPGAHQAVLELKHAADLQTASLSQAALARLLGTIDYDDVVARARRFYAERCARLIEALRRYLPEAAFVEPEGGFSIWVETGEGGDDIALLEAAIEEGVVFDPGSAFRPGAGARGGDTERPLALRLSYSNAAPELYVEGARRLGRALAVHRRRTPRAA